MLCAECKSGHRSAKDKVALFRFPKESGLRQKWIDAIPRKSWVLSSNHRVCTKHFSSDDFVRESCDLRARRKRKRDTFKLERLRLRDFHFISSMTSTHGDVTSSPTRRDVIDEWDFCLGTKTKAGGILCWTPQLVLSSQQ